MLNKISDNSSTFTITQQIQRTTLYSKEKEHEAYRFNHVATYV